VSFGALEQQPQYYLSAAAAAAATAATAFRVCHGESVIEGKAEPCERDRGSERGSEGASERASERERERERERECVSEGGREGGGRRNGAPVGYHTQHRASRAGEPIAERRRCVALSRALSGRAVRLVLRG